MDAIDAGSERQFFSPKTRIAVCGALLFGSGAAGLLYQTLWQRSLSLFFGATSDASAAVLSIFMGGLGFGGLFLGKRAERHRAPLALYGRLEVGVALFAALSPLFIDALGRLYLLSGGSAQLGLPLSTLFRLLVSILAVGPAAFLMGGTLPAMVRAATAGDDESRRSIGILYGINTLGAVVGALVGTFFLFEVFGTTFSLLLTALLNALIGILAIGTSRQFSAPSELIAPTTSTSEVPNGPKTTFIIGVLGLVGFAFLGLELVWYRLLTPLLGGSTYSFGLILASVLLGIGVGGALYALRDKTRPPTLAELASVTALEALFTTLPFALGDRLAVLTAGTRVLAVYGFFGLTVSWSLLLAIVVFPASLVAGYQYPLLLALLGRGNSKIARDTGRAYAANTLGGVIGALSIGFTFIPHLGAPRVFWVLGFVLAIVAIASASLALAERAPRAKIGSGFAIASLLFVALVRDAGPSPLFRHLPIGAGRSNLAKLGSKNELRALESDLHSRIRWARDGREAAVALDDSDGLSFIINGKSDGSTEGDKETQAMLALLPLALQKAPEKVFLVGLGSGMSAGFAAQHPTVTHVAVSEMERVILDVAKESATMNLHALDNPKVKISLGDAREHLLASREKYDVIASEPSNPYRAGISMLFTSDFYRVARDRLEKGGVFAQWLQGYEIDSSVVLLVLSTLRSEFSHVEVWQTQANDFLLLASETPLSVDVAVLRENLEKAPYDWALPRVWHTTGVEGFLAHRVASGAFVNSLVERAKMVASSDDQNFLEFSFARSVGRSGLFPMEVLFETSVRNRGRFEPLLEAKLDRTLLDVGDARVALSSGSLGQNSDRYGVTARKTAEGCLNPSKELSGFAWDLPRESLDPIELTAKARALALSAKQETDLYVAELEKRGYVAEAFHADALLRETNGNLDAAFASFAKAASALTSESFPICSTPKLVLDLANRLANSGPLALRVRDALLRSFSGFEQEARRKRFVRTLGLLALGAPHCVEAFGETLETPYWDEEFLTLRFLCLKGGHHPLAARAEADLAEYLARGVGTFE